MGDVRVFLEGLDELTDFEICVLGKVDGFPISYLRPRSFNASKQNILLTAGVHGNEPAGVYALLDFLHDPHLSYNIFAYPCTNPTGFVADTRNNSQNQNVNRTFGGNLDSVEASLVMNSLAAEGKQYAFTWDFHEDNINDNPTVEGYCDGIYLYELSPEHAEKGHIILDWAGGTDIPVTRRKRIQFGTGGYVNDGVVSKTPGIDGTLSAFLFDNFTEHAFTAETPTTYSLETRVKVHLRLLEQAIELFAEYRM